MRDLTQKQLDKMPVISTDMLSKTGDSMRNYIVYVGESFATLYHTIHVGFDSFDHLETIKTILNGQPIFKVLIDNRKW